MEREKLRTARVPIFQSTFKRLLSKKIKKQAELDKKLTWDEFLLEHKEC